MSLVIIVVLVVIILLLLYYNSIINKKIDTFNNINNQIIGLNVLQDFMNTISEAATANEKLVKINEILINRYNIKYSTIVTFNGATFEVIASNVDRKHYDTLKNLQAEPVFSESIQKRIAKYITVNGENDKLPYQKMEFDRAKSAMFFPLYIGNVLIGYWLIEGSAPHEFDGLDTTILEVVKSNIITVLKTIQAQSTMENIVRDDLYSSLKSAEYLYGNEIRGIIEKYPYTVLCLFKITNLVEINEKVSRKTGDKVITEVAKEVKANLAPEYTFVRFMGPKFAIVFNGAEGQGAYDFMTQIKSSVEQLEITPGEDYVGDEKVIVTPKINVVLASYYKGTAIDGLAKQLEKYLDEASPSENQITLL